MFCFCSRDDAAQNVQETQRTWPIPKISETLLSVGPLVSAKHSDEVVEERPRTRTRRSYGRLTPEHKFDSAKEIEY